MNEQQIYRILGLENVEEATEKDIQNAYRTKLKTVHPEDDPEGFKKLRQAYEIALSNLRNKSVDVEEDTEDGYYIEDPEIGKWIQKVDEVYNYFPKRISADEWKILLQDEVCTDLDKCDMTREAFLVYAMSHFRLPTYIWKQVDDTFNITDDKEELFEIFDSKFIEFVLNAINNNNWNYSLFEGAPTADYDAYIGALIKLGNGECLDEAMDILENSGIIYPTGEINKMIHFTNIGDAEKANKAEQLLRDKFFHILHVQYNLALISLHKNNYDQFIQECDMVLNQEPEHYGMNITLASFHLSKERYEEAYKIMSKLKNIYSNIDNDENFIKMFHEILDNLIPQVKEEMEKNPEDDNIKMHLATLYLQRYKFEAGIKIAESINKDNVNLIQYYKLLSDLYHVDIEESKDYILKYIKACEEATQLDKIDLYYEKLAMIIYNESEGKSDELLLALDYINKAIEINGENLQYIVDSIKIHYKLEEYAKCIELCDYLEGELSEDDDKLELYKMRIDAANKLMSINLVLESYMNLVEYSPENPYGHILALEMCIEVEDKDLTEHILSWVNAYEIESLELDFLKAKAILLSEDKKDEDQIRHVINVLSEIIEVVENDETANNDLKDINQVYFTMAHAYYYVDDCDKVLKFLQQYMNSSTDKYDMDIAYKLMGFALQKEEQYEEAVSFFEKSLEIVPDNTSIMHQLVECYVKLDLCLKVIETTEKILEIDSEDERAMFWIRNAYIEKFKQTTNQEDYLNAIKFGKKFDELTKSAFSNLVLGRIYELGNDRTNVVIYLEKAIQLKKDLSEEHYAEAMIKLATAYKLLKNYKQAIEYALKVIWLPDKTHHAKAYSTLSICYQQKNEFNLAIHYLEQEIKVENNLVTTLFNLADIFDIYLAQGDMDNAKKIMQKVIKISNKED
ncbi:hypothetical protein AN639_04315, partial [Candidatus Epulonipiscium fishelsonii]